jgi:hypothetical protein
MSRCRRLRAASWTALPTAAEVTAPVEFGPRGKSVLPSMTVTWSAYARGSWPRRH